MQKLKALSSLLCLLCLSGCYHWSRLQETGATPPMTPTQDPRAHKNYAPVRMPMPDAKNPRYSPNSLWRTGTKSFFKDQRGTNMDRKTSRHTINPLYPMENKTVRITRNALTGGGCVEITERPILNGTPKVNKTFKYESNNVNY